MSQKARLLQVKVTGQVYLGSNDEGAPFWSREPSEVLRWMTDGWRFRFNQHRSLRHKYVHGFGDQAGADAEGRVLVTLGRNPVRLSDKEAREQHSFLQALPAMVLQSPERVENKEWFAAAKRRATNRSKKRKAGAMPGFLSRKHSDARFVCWFNGGQNATYSQTGKRSGMIVIRGQNPTCSPDGTRRWQIKLRVRHTQEILPYTSVVVNVTRQEVVFTSPPKQRTHQHRGNAVGIDVGVTNTVATSHGDFHSLPDLKRFAQDVSKHQRRMAKSRLVAEREGRDYRKSRRYQAHKAMAAGAAAKAARVREDWAHKTAAMLVDSFDLIGIENLHLKNMTKKGRGKRGLNRSMLNSALGQLRSFIEYKGDSADVPVIAVRANGTSQRCRPCGHTAKENRKSQAVFRCVSCNYRAHADTNAAGNVEDDAVEYHAVRTKTGAGSVTKTKQAQAGRAHTVNRKPPEVGTRASRPTRASRNPRP